MPNPICLTLLDVVATERLGAKLAAVLRMGDVVALSGDLGAGKSVLARAIIRALTGNDEEEVPSPTFTLVQCYDSPAGMVWHYDLYRLSAADEVVELGWEEAGATGIVLVEWPERLGGLLPAEHLEVSLTQAPVEADADADARCACLIGHVGWAGRLAALSLGNL
ncbi:MAG: tRNA (adenosine(37)-N6)-threonylcarbamoyltransferase complex ATPase subunit type 1 TsaE [Rhodospirillaceae bacterium]